MLSGLVFLWSVNDGIGGQSKLIPDVFVRIGIGPKLLYSKCNVILFTSVVPFITVSL